MKRIGITGLGAVVLACSFDPGGTAGGQGASFGEEGSTQSAETGDGSDPTTSITATTGSATSASAGTVSSGPAKTTTTGPDVSTSSPTSSTAGTTDETAESSTGSDNPLQGHALVRYYLDEANAGMAPQRAEDATDNPFDLRVEYDGGVGHWTEVNGNRGFAIDAASSFAGFTDPIEGEEIELLDETKRATYEVVVALTGIAPEFSRILHLGAGMDRGDLTLGTNNLNHVELFWERSVLAAQWPVAWIPNGRTVLHVVVDLDDLGNQARLYVDGVEVAPNSFVTRPSLAIVIRDNAFLGVANRVGERSIQGTLFYAAVYDEALSSAQVAANAAMLELNDDHP